MPRRLPTPPASTMAMLRVMCVKMKGVFLVGDDRWRRLMEFGGVVAGRSGWGERNGVYGVPVLSTRLQQR